MNIDRKAEAKLESLEPRRLLAAEATAVLSADGTLVVTGTDGDDLIILNRSSFRVTVNGVNFDFEASPPLVTNTVVRALGGNDDIHVVEGYATGTPVTVDGGDGDDLFVLFDRNAHVIGGLGDDLVQLFGFGRLLSFEDAGGLDTLDFGSSLNPGVSVLDMRQYPGLDNVINARTSIIGNELDNLISYGDSDFAGPYMVWGGAGNDTVKSGVWPVMFHGQDGDDLFINEIVGAFFGDPRFYMPDTFVGGDGSDTIDYSFRGGPIIIDLASGLGGEIDENDILIGVENAIGGAGDDLLIGTAGSNVLVGGVGNDTLIGNGGKDTLIGGAGNDLFLARDNKKDQIIGGDGDDTAIADKKDKLFEVEVVEARNNGKKKGQT